MEWLYGILLTFFDFEFTVYDFRARFLVFHIWLPFRELECYSVES